jgi:hypothetical protein
VLHPRLLWERKVLQSGKGLPWGHSYIISGPIWTSQRLFLPPISTLNAFRSVARSADRALGLVPPSALR